MKTALIVVDMLSDFFDRSPALAAKRPQLVAGTNALVRAFRSWGQPIIWIRQEFARDLHDAFLEMRTNNVSITIAGTAASSDLEHHDVTLRYLDGKIARVLPSTDVVAALEYS